MTSQLGQEAPVARATARFVRVTPMKARRVVDLIRYLPTDEALALLRFAPQSASEPVAKVVASAVANAEHNLRLDGGAAAWAVSRPEGGGGAGAKGGPRAGGNRRPNPAARPRRAGGQRRVRGRGPDAQADPPACPGRGVRDQQADEPHHRRGER